MDNNDITYRVLTKDDLPIYVDLYDSLSSMMKLDKIPEFKESLIKTFCKENRIIVGSFDKNNILISSLSGYFPVTFNCWYCYHNFSRPINNGLSSHNTFATTFMNMINLLIEYGEPRHYFNFYVRRSIKQQQTFEKMLKLITDKNIVSELRYDIFYEKVYESIPTSTPLTNHEFYFNKHQVSFDVPSIIMMHSLKQKFRKEILLNVPL